MSWQLANEPRPGRGEMSLEAIQGLLWWIDGTAGFIKSLAQNHLVSSGSEGQTGSLDSMDNFVCSPIWNISLPDIHMWAKKIGAGIDPNNMEDDLF